MCALRGGGGGGGEIQRFPMELWRYSTFHTGASFRSLLFPNTLALCRRDSMFHTTVFHTTVPVERFDVSHWYGREI